MTQLSDALAPQELAALNAVAPTENRNIGEPSNTTERILDAYDVARVYAEQIKDPEYKKNVEEKLVRSNVRGSSVRGVRTPEDVVTMIKSVSNWQTVVANLKDKSIICLQGELPAAYNAHAAYASVREIDLKFSSAGLSTIQAKRGYQHDDDYYFCTVQWFPTNILTVQLKKDESGCEHLHQWFAGPELTSRTHFNDGDVIVRCGVIIPLATDQKRGKQQNGAQKNRLHRAD